MRKKVFGRRFKRDHNERKALFKGLMSSLVTYGRIKTTEEKAKAIKGHVEKLVTKAKKGAGVANQMQEFLSPDSIKKLIESVAPQFANRPGGYTRIVRLGKRFNDDASMVILEWVEEISVKSEKLKVKSEPKKETETVQSAIEAPKRGRKSAVKKSETEKKPVKRGRPAKKETK